MLGCIDMLTGFTGICFRASFSVRSLRRTSMGDQGTSKAYMVTVMKDQHLWCYIELSDDDHETRVNTTVNGGRNKATVFLIQVVRLLEVQACTWSLLLGSKIPHLVICFLFRVYNVRGQYQCIERLHFIEEVWTPIHVCHQSDLGMFHLMMHCVEGVCIRAAITVSRLLGDCIPELSSLLCIFFHRNRRKHTPSLRCWSAQCGQSI